MILVRNRPERSQSHFLCPPRGEEEDGPDAGSMDIGKAVPISHPFFITEHIMKSINVLNAGSSEA